MILALAGGVGGAKLAQVWREVLAPDALTVVVNTGDDFEHLGLHVSPDLDTVMYTLAGINDTRARLGHRRRDLELHARAGAARWRDVVPARRSRPRDARASARRRLRSGRASLSAVTAATVRGARHCAIASCR